MRKVFILTSITLLLWSMQVIKVGVFVSEVDEEFNTSDTLVVTITNHQDYQIRTTIGLERLWKGEWRFFIGDFASPGLLRQPLYTVEAGDSIILTLAFQKIEDLLSDLDKYRVVAQHDSSGKEGLRFSNAGNEFRIIK